MRVLSEMQKRAPQGDCHYDGEETEKAAELS